ncbi:SnoaL-like domain-containing protein [Chitinophaga sp. CF118]|uniref:nuclear transport factor 2 family protein n=1 Tax=Chitinophaga sp. CF118 TaxID=1884367 RepID=UPI0008EE2812|nr:nuclear transport factor 2 family protein [Chitinophaga sp. CF118]SFD24879.1 SnoaL-like domain-containing protein [Chitinophaga sp. CF118]
MSELAQHWLHAWNTHNLDAIMEHYSEDVVFYSPFIQKLNNDPSGCIHGVTALRAYFQKALIAYPDLQFEPYHIMEGVNSLVLYYKSVGNRLAAEMMLLNAAGKVAEVRAHYKNL